MTLRILYFAGLRDAVGIAEETVELDELDGPHEPRGPGELAGPDELASRSRAAPTVRALADHLARRHPAYAARRAFVRIARNEAFATDDEALVDGDVVALIPPVAGG